jgi:hypothetical protein
MPHCCSRVSLVVCFRRHSKMQTNKTKQ